MTYKVTNICIRPDPVISHDIISESRVVYLIMNRNTEASLHGLTIVHFRQVIWSLSMLQFPYLKNKGYNSLYLNVYYED